MQEVDSVECVAGRGLRGDVASLWHGARNRDRHGDRPRPSGDLGALRESDAGPGVQVQDDTVGILSDAWAFLVIREAFFGARRFEEFRSGLEISRATLTDRLRRLIVDQAGLILRRAIDPDRSFAEHGLDSLGMLELRTSVETQTGIRISPKTIVSYNTARSLAAHLSESLAAEA